MTKLGNPDARATMNGKPVFEVDVKTVLNTNSGFGPKLLCDFLTFSLSDTCVYSCCFCFVPQIYQKLERVSDVLDASGLRHEDVVIRRKRALEVLESQLVHPNGKKKYPDPNDRRVIYSSPAVDVAANMELSRETIEACRIILKHTSWHIRLLSKSNLLPIIAEALADYKDRMIYGVSTGTVNDAVARAFEQGTPLVSKRLKSLHWLQDHGYRTFGMICPSLPQATPDAYRKFAEEASKAIRAEKCEHVWAEVINVRGESMTRTVSALAGAGLAVEAALLEHVSSDTLAWDAYNRATFLAHAEQYNAHPGKLRFLTYTTKSNLEWWEGQRKNGAVLL